MKTLFLLTALMFVGCSTQNVVEAFPETPTLALLKLEGSNSLSELRVLTDGTVEQRQVRCCPKQVVSIPERSLNTGERARVLAFLNSPIPNETESHRVTVNNSAPMGTLTIWVNGREVTLKKVELVSAREAIVTKVKSPLVDDLEQILSARVSEPLPE